MALSCLGQLVLASTFVATCAFTLHNDLNQVAHEDPLCIELFILSILSISSVAHLFAVDICFRLSYSRLIDRSTGTFC